MSIQRNSASRSFLPFFPLLVFLLLVLFILNAACSNEKAQSPKPQKETREQNQGPQVLVKEKSVEPAGLSDTKHPLNPPKVTFIELEFKDQVRIVFHDVWTPEGKRYADMYGIHVIPTQVFLDREGKEYFRHESYFPKEELVKVLRQKGVK